MVAQETQLSPNRPEVVPLPEFDTHVLKRVLRLESDANDAIPLTDDQIDRDVIEYLEFLRDRKIRADVHVVPPVRVDRVWHIHIIQTQNYREVCEMYLGYFLEHASMICGAGGDRIERWDFRE